MASTRVTVLVVVIVVLAATITTEAQQLPSCLQKLIPCFEYLNYTGELAPCCDGLKEAMANEVPCLCEFARAHGLLSYSKVVGVDFRSPFDIPRECGVPDTIPCDDDKDDGADNAAPPPVVEHSKPNGAGRMIARTAISSFLLFNVLLMML